MQLEGKYDIPAEPSRVWDALNDPEILKDCIPGCESLDQVSPAKYDAVVCLKIGVIKARFKGNAEMTEQQPPNRCVISFSGAGGGAGMARGEAKVKMTPTKTGTEMVYVTDVVIGGKIAQIGSKLIRGTAQRLSDKFFSSFVEKMNSMQH